jgi:hypothetical protein
MRRINIVAEVSAIIVVCLTLWSTIGGSTPVVHAQVAPITQKIDTELLYLIDQYAGQEQYYNSAWDISIDQYKAWVATIAWAEGSGRYAAHSQYGSSKENITGDRFDHVAAGDAFRFSTGIGPFQLDPIVSTWPTIYKLNAKKALLFVLAWHRNSMGAGSTLQDFSTNSPWLAVWPDYIAVRWQQVTNTNWDDHKNGIAALDWNGEIRPRLQRVDDFDDSVRYIGRARWNARVTTDTLKTVVFEGHFNTWLISARGWETDVLYTYYYTYSKGVSVYDESTGLVTYDPDTGCEVWVWNNAGQPNEYRYVFAREFTEGRFPELRTLEGGYWMGERYVAKAGQTLPSPALNPNDLGNEQVSKGLTWLRQHQNTDGSWTYTGRISESNVGLTSMAAACFLNYGLAENDDLDLCRALNWICEHQNEDGSITTGTYHIYDTSLAIMALVAAQKSDYYEDIREAVDYLLVNQNRAETGYPESNKYYGGWSYGPWLPDWADLSNSQFVLFALHYAENVIANDTLVPAEVWDRAEVFVQRCQNREASNPNWNFYDDGGFIYQPGSTIWAGGQSYASITAAGLWGLFTCGIGESDGRVQDAWGWIENNYYLNQNYPIGSLFNYYYAYSLAKACVLWNVEEINGHDWYQEMSELAVNYQQADGHWPGTDPSEEPDIVATCWALLALESKLIPAGTVLHIEVHSPADLHVYDPLGRHVGINYETGEAEIEIPGATYSGPGTEPQIIEIPDPMAGTYRIELVGRERGDYTLTIEGRVGTTTVYSRSFEGSIDEGETKGLDAIVSAIAGPITIDIPDTVPPGTVTDLVTGSPALNFVTLSWTAPGDDWNTGTAAEYDIRYSTQPITEANWDEAIPCEGEPAPQPSGSGEVFTVTGLAPGATYYFALKTADEIPNWSELSNVAQGSTFVTAIVDFDPDTLSFKNKGKVITVYIELPPGYDVSQIDIPSVRLNGTVPPLTTPTTIGDYDRDGIADLMVKFDGAAVKSLLTPGDRVDATITGQVAGIGFQGTDTIRVIKG